MLKITLPATTRRALAYAPYDAAEIATDIETLATTIRRAGRLCSQCDAAADRLDAMAAALSECVAGLPLDGIVA